MSNKIIFFIIYWFYNLNQCLVIAMTVPSDANQFPVQQMAQMPNIKSQHSMSGFQSGDLRVFPFVVDPLIIIALIALPTIGMLGLSSLIMPLIPIAIYLIQLFFPIGGSGKRRKREIDYNITDSYFENELQLFYTKLSEAFDKYTHL